MKAFMDKEFMLQSPVAQHLYHTYAADMPICDYHCHISPKEIYENRRFENIAQVWLGGRQPDGSLAGDHYKWRVTILFVNIPTCTSNSALTRLPCGLRYYNFRFMEYSQKKAHIPVIRNACLIRLYHLLQCT